MAEREVACAPVTMPAGIAEAVRGYHWARDHVGESGGAVYRLSGRADAPDLFLKHGTGVVADEIVAEMVRLRWLAAYVPVPDLVAFVALPDAAWLLTTALAGETAWQLLDRAPEQRGAVVDALAGFLRRLHAIPVAHCPFDAGHRLHLAQVRIDAELVDEADFDDARAGWSAQQVWDALQGHLPLPADPVVTHGDFSLDNLLLQDGEVTGCIDLGRVGIADRYQDLAILANCLGAFDDALVARMFVTYGVAEPDGARMAFHLLLDELF
ncbi:APH(3')-I family aminoglycoside O-phosphotransferase [Sphingomonas sp. 2R-10]|uniref:APH(3')-I family aminoglycoside O-phosphotransferase n=1 Tax=Sphingomonas sp. 2R-10 TaxID=3045148 RepID=UPI0024BAA5EC|nr:APH(3')-I family aminoglycoside O-phosphotransferase [Sphingomonas sp. 2R-10]MDJ0276413.1 APH(3')-I family aminoglycoside O-phosphotransferase [Sphingomonas sp. 2R-10]